MSLQYAVSKRSVGSHCTPRGVTPPLGISDRGVIQPGESLFPLTMVPSVTDLSLSVIVRSRHACVNLSRLRSRFFSCQHCALAGSPSPATG